MSVGARRRQKLSLDLLKRVPCFADGHLQKFMMCRLPGLIVVYQSGKAELRQDGTTLTTSVETALTMELPAGLNDNAQAGEGRWGNVGWAENQCGGVSG
jgi:hypothetical protein